MYSFILVNLVAIPLALIVHPDFGKVVHDTFVPSVQGGLDGTALLLIISIVGTTVAPWQLFFQQSNFVDKRITPRWINYESWDTVIGSLATEIGAMALLIAAAFAFAGSDFAGQFTDAGGVATGLAQVVGPAAGLFAIFLLAAIIGAAAVTLATSYAFGDVFGIRHSLHRGIGEAKGPGQASGRPAGWIGSGSRHVAPATAARAAAAGMVDQPQGRHAGAAGSRGDVEPVVGLTVRLRALGAEVRCMHRRTSRSGWPRSACRWCRSARRCADGARVQVPVGGGRAPARDRVDLRAVRQGRCDGRGM